MYDELYAAWRLEIENGELGSLPSDFYAQVTDYLRRIKEESKMLDKKNVRTNLLEKEMANMTRKGAKILSSGTRDTGGGFCYLEIEELPGVVVEFVQ